MNYHTRKNIVIIASSLILLLTGCGNNKASTKQTAQPTAKPVQQQQYQPAPAPQPAQPQQQQAESVTTLMPADAAKLIASRKDLLIIDVREPQELREGSIAGSQLIPFMQVARGQHTIPKNKPLLVVCAVGGRSIVAAQLLHFRQGYTDVYNLKGGIDGWKKAGLPVK